MKIVYTLQERIKTVSLYFKNDNSTTEVVRAINVNHLDKRIHYNYYVSGLMTKIMETASVAKRKQEPERRMRNRAVKMAIVDHLQMDNIKSLRKVA